jgi:putative nucleotidyltransferase with HDIG domain
MPTYVNTPVSKKTPKGFHREKIIGLIQPIITDTHFQGLRTYRQHIFMNRYEHLVHVSVLSYHLARWCGADVRVCVLAGLLHDYHFTTYKSYVHGLIAAENAKRFAVPDEVLHIIRAHMLPSGRRNVRRPKGRNFWVVKSADCIAAWYEVTR